MTECVYCNPTLQGKGPKVRMKHKKCSPTVIKDNVIKEYELQA